MKRILVLSALFLSASCFAQPVVQSGDVIAFLGDSITQQGGSQPGGTRWGSGDCG